MADITLKIKRLDPTIPLPAYAYSGDAGLDLRSIDNVAIRPGKRVAIHTGLSVAIPEGYAGFVQPRSGLALKKGLSIVNTPGLVDSHYRGELVVIAINTDDKSTIEISKGDRIAQLVIQAVPTVELLEVDELDNTDRGEGGFGSSGIA